MTVPKLQNSRLHLPAIVVLATALRVAAALYLGDEITALPGTHDQISYDALAQSLLAGRGYSFLENWYPFTTAGEPTAHWSFLYPLFLAGVYDLFGYHPLIARLLQAVVGGVASSLLIFHIGCHLGGRRVGLLGAALAAVYGYFIYYSAALMTETWFMVAVLSAMLIALQLREKSSLRDWILLGLALGVGTLLRQTMLVLVPVLLLWLAWTSPTRLALWQPIVLLSTIALFIVPWTIRNQRVYQEFLLLNSNAGYALYAANHPRLDTIWNNEDIVVPIPDEMAGLNEAQLDRALTKKAIGFIRADPFRYLVLTIDKSLEYFKFWPSATSSLISNVTRVFSFGLYMPFMLAGIVLSLSRWRNYLLVYLVVGAHTTVYLLSWPAIRYRLPMDALLMPLAALAVIYFARLVRGWRKTEAYA